MIGRLRGTIAGKQPPHLLLDVRGVGYELEAPMSTFYVIPETGAEVLLHTHLAIRDDAHVLYGFATVEERALFRALIKVSGVGAKLALAVLSGMASDAFARCIQDGDAAALSRLPGIGKKTAERLIVEMRDRLGVLQGFSRPASLPGTTSGPGPSPRDDAVTALEALGYRPVDAQRMLRGIECEGRTSEEIIRRALQAAVQR